MHSLVKTLCIAILLSFVDFGIPDSGIIYLPCHTICVYKTVLQIRRVNRDNFGITVRITPLKHVLQPIIRTVSPRRF